MAATPNGAYRASLDGARSIAWTFPEPLEGFSFERFASRFERPDLVERSLAGEETTSEASLARPPAEHAHHRDHDLADGEPLQLLLGAILAHVHLGVDAGGEPGDERDPERVYEQRPRGEHLDVAEDVGGEQRRVDGERTLDRAGDERILGDVFDQVVQAHERLRTIAE